MAELLTVPEVCAMLRRSRWSVYADVKRGDLPAVRIGRNLRFRPADLDAYLASRAVRVTATA